MASAETATMPGHMIVKHYISILSVFGEHITSTDTTDMMYISRSALASTAYEKKRALFWDNFWDAVELTGMIHKAQRCATRPHLAGACLFAGILN